MKLNGSRQNRHSNPNKKWFLKLNMGNGVILVVMLVVVVVVGGAVVVKVVVMVSMNTAN